MISKPFIALPSHQHSVASDRPSTSVSPESPREQELSQLAEIGARAVAIVHEMRNPLTTVLLGLTTCQKIGLPEPAETGLRFALDEAARLQRLIDEILLYAKPLALQRHDLELNDLIQAVLASFTFPKTLERRIDFLGTADAVWIKGDRDKLKQVLINLVTNACEAVTAGETITCTLELNAKTNLVWLRLHNGGKPIAPDALSQVAQPFFTTKPDGNGLGLAIAQQIVEAHGGKLAIASSSSAGTTVSVGLPIARLIPTDSAPY